jgi:lysophospholipid acyltransferase (LPLAT)-like uncharacterized protein
VKLRKPWQQRVAATIGALVLRSLGATWRVDIRYPDPVLPGIYMFLHGHILMAAWSHRGHGYPILIGTHRDAELIARIARRFGFETIRGSSTRGGAVAAREILRRCREEPVTVTPDGPRGPRGSVKPGLVLLAAHAGVPLIPMVFATTRGKRLGSWDRFTIPAPFARVLCRFGDPIHVPPDLDDDGAAELAVEVSRRLLETEAAAESEAGRW